MSKAFCWRSAQWPADFSEGKVPVFRRLVQVIGFVFTMLALATAAAQLLRARNDSQNENRRIGH